MRKGKKEMLLRSVEALLQPKVLAAFGRLEEEVELVLGERGQPKVLAAVERLEEEAAPMQLAQAAFDLRLELERTSQQLGDDDLAFALCDADQRLEEAGAAAVMLHLTLDERTDEVAALFPPADAWWLPNTLGALNDARWDALTEALEEIGVHESWDVMPD